MAKNKATMKQEIFCQEYVDTIGNGARSALKAFDIIHKEILDIPEKNRTKEAKVCAKNAFNTASVMATEYLRKPNIIKRIDEILEERGFTDESVKVEHYKLIKGSDDNVRMRAIDSYYKLKGKNEPEKFKLDQEYEELTTEELRRRIEELENRGHEKRVGTKKS